MDVRISFTGVGPGNQVADLESLGGWLRDVPELAGHVADDHAPSRAGELGVLGDALVVSVGSGGALSALVLSLKAWLAQPRRSHVRIRVQGDHGRSVDIDAEGVDRDQLEALIRHAIGGGSLGG